jgi:hypothetical protein
MHHNQYWDESMIGSDAREVGVEDLAVALQRGVGADWLDRKLDLWNVMQQTVHGWQFPRLPRAR